MTKATLQGIVLDDRYELTIADICHACGGTTEWVLELVEEGVLEPRNETGTDLRFPGSALRLARTAMRLQRDLGVNAPGVALALDMLDELDTLRARLRAAGHD